MVFSKQGVGEEKTLRIQGMDIPTDNHYIYLGITVSDSVNYLDLQEKIWREKSRKGLNQLQARALWGFNRFEISKTLWKAVAVPALTYANAVAVMSKTLENEISTAQTQAGRYALGIPSSKVANEFVQGEMGWSSFRAREAQSKIRYFHRV